MRARIASLQEQQLTLSRRSIYQKDVSDRINAEILPLKERLLAIQSHPISRKSAVRAFFSASPYTDEALQQIKPLQKAIDEKLASIPMSIESEQRGCDYQIAQINRTIAEYEAALEPHRKREVRQEKLESLQKRRIAELSAAAASATGTTRQLGSKVRTRLPRQQQCPYCGGSLGISPHADHIYPVSKGGRSVERNMVFVCPSCNTKKAHRTLSAFIKTFGLDRDEIEARLTELGKDF